MEITNEVKSKFFPNGCNNCEADIEHLSVFSELEIYGKEYSDNPKSYWRCSKCSAHVSCHPDCITPAGVIADKRVRAFRKRVHGLLDPIWKYYVKEQGMQKKEARPKAYQWLADKMELNKKDCHIGCFDEKQCIEAINILNEAYQKSASLRNFIKKS